MKVGIFGGIILLILTIVFSFMAIQNNKIARQITVDNFHLTKNKKPENHIIVDNNNSYLISEKSKDNNVSEIKRTTSVKQNNWKTFDEKFKDFDSKFKDF
jgi:hypothetical protein